MGKFSIYAQRENEQGKDVPGPSLVMCVNWRVF